MVQLTEAQKALAHARAAEDLLDSIAAEQPLVKPHVRLIAVQAQALVSIATSLAVLIDAAAEPKETLDA